MRRWTAPQDGTAHITGTARDLDSGGGDGVVVSIRHGATEIWQATINNGNTTGVAFDLTRTMRQGETLDFVINRRGNNSCDSTSFNPTIVLSTAGSDTTPPVLSSVAASSITSTSAVVSWGSNEASNSQVEYGPTASYGTTTPLNGQLVTSHTVALSGLVANTDYFYRVRSADAAGNLATSSGTFRTASGSAGGTTTYGAEADFSLVQGTRGWSYLDSNGSGADAGRHLNKWWQGGSLSLGPTGGHPGATRDAVRRWTAPQDGTAHITGTARDLDSGGGDGVVVLIRHGATELWRATINNGNTTGVAFDLTEDVRQGETLDFVINRRANHYWDSTYFNPTITLAHTLGP